MEHSRHQITDTATTPPLTQSPPRAAFSSEATMILREGREATLATLRPDGWPQNTIITYVNDETHVYFACGAASQKVQNMERDDRVSLAVLAPYAAYGPIFGLSLAGHSQHLSQTVDIARVIELWKKRHPYMPERAQSDKRDFLFYAVRPIVVQTLDYRAALGYGRRN